MNSTKKFDIRSRDWRIKIHLHQCQKPVGAALRAIREKSEADGSPGLNQPAIYGQVGQAGNIEIGTWLEYVQSYMYLATGRELLTINNPDALFLLVFGILQGYMASICG